MSYSSQDDEEMQYGDMALPFPGKAERRIRSKKPAAVIKVASKIKGGAKTTPGQKSVFRRASLLKLLRRIVIDKHLQPQASKDGKKDQPEAWKWSKNAVDMVSSALEMRLRDVLKDAWMIASYRGGKTITERAVERSLIRADDNVMLMKDDAHMQHEHHATSDLLGKKLTNVNGRQVESHLGRKTDATNKELASLISLAAVRRLKMLVAAAHIKPGVTVSLRNVTLNYLTSMIFQLVDILQTTGKSTISPEMVQQVLGASNHIAVGFGSREKGSRKAQARKAALNPAKLLAKAEKQAVTAAVTEAVAEGNIPKAEAIAVAAATGTL
jgi:histone H3/H4